MHLITVLFIPFHLLDSFVFVFTLFNFLGLGLITTVLFDALFPYPFLWPGTGLFKFLTAAILIASIRYSLLSTVTSLFGWSLGAIATRVFSTL
jgi:hypothetical protein